MNILNKLTRSYLKLNKKRTLVTIIGIILTGAMISGVTTLGASFQAFMVNIEKQDSGDWQASFGNISYENAQYIEKNNKIEESFLARNYGFAQNLENEESFIEIREYSEKTFDKMNIKVEEGKMPQNSNEIVVSENFLATNPNVQLGDEITLNIGKELIRSEEKVDDNSYIKSEMSNPIESKNYKIVGIIRSPRFEYDNVYGAISLLERNKLTNSDTVSISVTMKETKTIYEDTAEIAKNLNLYSSDEMKCENLAYNTSVLLYQGVNSDDEFSVMLITVCAVLIVVIAIGSIVVIYTSFAISVSERKKQFGMLASIGATKKQIRKMVLYEGFVVGIIGIPLGILSGILGIGVTLKVVDKLIRPMFAQDYITAQFELVVSYPILLISIVLIAITIFLSVFIPAKMAAKTSPIDTIRGAGDIKIKSKKVRTPKFLRKIYGIEGDIALKNLKRSKKKYRTTVISLTISIVLFLTFNGFVSYMFEGFEALYMTTDYDYEMNFSADKNKQDEIINELLKINGNDRIVAQKIVNGKIDINNDNMHNSLKEIINKNDALKSTYLYENGNGEIQAYIVQVDDKYQEEYLKKVGVDSLANGECIISNHVDGLYLYKAEYDIFDYKQNDILNVKTTQFIEEQENYSDTTINNELKIKQLTNEVPYGIPGIVGYAIIIVNEETYEAIQSSIAYETIEILAKTDDTAKLDEAVDVIMEKYPDVYYNGNDVKEQMELIKNLKLIIEIFLYGFIVLISLIGISNIFNTITTNVALRKREFANLKSIGMTDKSFNKMMNLECIFYGTKSLIYGLPLGVFMCYLLTKAFGNAVTFMFEIPWSSIAIVVVAVYLIVFATMRYARNRIKKENIIDVLRDDNI